MLAGWASQHVLWDRFCEAGSASARSNLVLQKQSPSRGENWKFPSLSIESELWTLAASPSLAHRALSNSAYSKISRESEVNYQIANLSKFTSKLNNPALAYNHVPTKNWKITKRATKRSSKLLINYQLWIAPKERSHLKFLDGLMSIEKLFPSPTIKPHKSWWRLERE